MDCPGHRDGCAVAPEPAGACGYEIERAYYDLEGRRVEPSGIGRASACWWWSPSGPTASGRRASSSTTRSRPGFEIDNPNLVKAGDVKGIDWLGLVDAPAHKEFRADRFVAAIDRGKKDPERFQIAYLVRAVSPGVFAHPAATVADMYRPERRARTASGAVEVVGALR